MDSFCKLRRSLDNRADESFAANQDTWVKNLSEEMMDLTKKTVESWAGTVSAIGVKEESMLNELIEDFKKQMMKTTQGILLKVEKERRHIENNIETLGKKYLSLVRQLKLPIFEPPEEMGLLEVKDYLDVKVKEYEKQLKERRRELDHLLNQHVTLSELLGVEPKYFRDCPLLSNEEMEDLKSQNEILEQEKYRLTEKFVNLKYEINQLFLELALTPESEFEKQILSQNDTFSEINKEIADKLEIYLKDLQCRAQTIKIEITDIRKKIDEIWEQLDIDFIERDQFRMKNQKDNLITLNELKKEYKRCNEIKKANIKQFIIKLRREIEKMWDKCYCSEEQKQKFQYYLMSDCFTEDLLDIHERELNDWSEFYEDNKETFHLIEEYLTLFKRQKEMDRNAEGVNKYKNRGGQLLKEERERNKILKRLPKLEEKLYEISQNNILTLYGKTVEQYINEKKMEIENEHKLKSKTISASREHLNKLTPGRSASKPLSLFNSRTVTPSAKRNEFSRAISSTSKKNLNSKCLTSVQPCQGFRRNLEQMFVSPKPLKSNKLAVVASKLNSSRKRRSSDKVKEIAKVKSKQEKQQRRDKENKGETSDYESFMNELSAKKACRSTTFREIVPNIVIEEIKQTPKGKRL